LKTPTISGRKEEFLIGETLPVALVPCLWHSWVQNIVNEGGQYGL